MARFAYEPHAVPQGTSLELQRWLRKELQQLRRAINEFSGEWEASIVPQWTASTDPAIGNGTLTGWYRRRQDMVTLSVRMTAGSTTTFGSGAWSFAPPASLALEAIGRWQGACRMQDATGNHEVGVAGINDGSSTVTIYPHGNANTVRDTVPFTWAQDDTLHFTIEYKVQD